MVEVRHFVSHSSLSMPVVRGSFYAIWLVRHRLARPHVWQVKAANMRTSRDW